MQEIFLQINSQDTLLYKNNLDSISSPKKQILAIHGIGTYSGWFNQLFEMLGQTGVGCHAIDLPGLGQSKSKHCGHVDSFREWFDAVQCAWTKMTQENPDAQNVILGHSLGGIIVLALAPHLYPRPADVISVVPALMSHSDRFGFGFYKSVLSKLIKGNCQDKVEIPPSEVEELESAVIDGRIEQCMLTPEVSAGLFWEIAKVKMFAWGNAKLYKDLPLSMILAGKDRTCLTQMSEFYFGIANSSTKRLKCFREFGHDLFIIPEFGQVNSLIADWISEL